MNTFGTDLTYMRHRVNAIREIRNTLGCGLRDAADLFDNHKTDWKEHVASIQASGVTYEGPLEKVRDAVRGYYAALDRREHGGVAQNKAFAQIEAALGMNWVQGATLKQEPDANPTQPR